MIMEQPLKIKHLFIRDLRSFGRYETDFFEDKVNVIQGGNGQGKSNLLDIIFYALGRRIDGTRSIAHDPMMLRGSAEDGEAILTLSDETQLRVLVKEGRTARMTKPPGNTRWDPSQEAIDSLVNAISYDPIKFRDMEPAKRVEALLKLLPPAVTKEQIVEAAGGEVALYPNEEVGLHTIVRVRQQVFEQRTEVGQKERALSGHVKELTEAIQQDSEPEDPAPLRAKRQAMIDEVRRHNTTVKRVQAEAVAEKKAEHFARLAAINDDINAQIKVLEAQRSSSIAGSMSQAQVEIDAINAEANEAIKVESPEVVALTAQLATAEANYKAWAASAGTKDAIARARASADEQTRLHGALTDTINRLDALKVATAKAMNIPGCSIEAPKPGLPVDICKVEQGGLVPFSEWNFTAQLFFCLKIAKWSKGRFGIVLIETDGVDKKNREAMMQTFARLTKEEGMQFVMVTATSGPLVVSDKVEAA